MRCDCGEAGTSGWSVGLGEAKHTHDSVLLGRAAEVLSSVRAALAGRCDVVNDADVDEKDYEEKGGRRALEVDVSAIGLTLRRLDSPLGCRLEGVRLKAATGGAGAGLPEGSWTPTSSSSAAPAGISPRHCGGWVRPPN